MSFIRGVNIPENSVLIVPDDSVLAGMETFLGMTVAQIRSHPYYEEYLRYITFEKPIKFGVNVSRGGMKMFYTKEGKLQAMTPSNSDPQPYGPLISILAVFENPKNNSSSAHIDSIFITNEQIEKFKNISVIDQDKWKKCENDTDPITMEEFSDMSPQDIITLGRYCYHLPSIFDWVFNRGKKTNPYTNLEFTEEEQLKLKETALQIYPFKIPIIIDPKNGIKTSLDTTSLTSIKRLFLNSAKLTGINVTDGLYSTLENISVNFVNMHTTLEDKSKTLFEYLVENQDEQLINLKLVDDPQIEYEILSDSSLKIIFLLHLLKIYRINRLPRDNINLRIRELATNQSVNDRSRNRQIDMPATLPRRLTPQDVTDMVRTADNQRYRIRLRIHNSVTGLRQGYFLSVPRDHVLARLEVDVRGILNDIPREMSAIFIYQGDIYEGNTPLSSLPDIRSGSIIDIMYS